MNTPGRHFVCLDPKKAKKEVVKTCLSPLGGISWLRVVPMRLRSYPETRKRAAVAFSTATKMPGNRLMKACKTLLLRWQYNGARAAFERNPKAIAVAWNGLNGTRRVFLDAARDAGSALLAFELCPFPNRITVDPVGVNFANGLPRTAAPYLTWATGRTDQDAWRNMRDQIRARPSMRQSPKAAPRLDEKFIFLPLQVPGDSQLRLFGGEYPNVETVIETVSHAAQSLPDGWHLRIKEHPSSPVRFDDLLARLGHSKLVVDNGTDTFSQVDASQGVVTVNSSVGLEAMFFDKAVVALGHCFWAIPSIAHACPVRADLASFMSDSSQWTYDKKARSAFLNFLTETYYPDTSQTDSKGCLLPTQLAKIECRLNGADELGFWESKGYGDTGLGC